MCGVDTITNVMVAMLSMFYIMIFLVKKTENNRYSNHKIYVLGNN
jgi:hypothetical protein